MDTTTLIIRPVRDDDFSAIAEITNHYIATTAIHFSTDPVAPEALREVWSQARERYPFVVATDGQTILGYAKAGVWRERAAYQWTPECGVYVRTGLHGRGLGRAMYDRLFRTMAAQGFRSVIAGATLPNEASVRMHESIGFVRLGVTRQAGWKMGQWWDVVFWQKMLSATDSAAAPLRRVSDVEAELGL